MVWGASLPLPLPLLSPWTDFFKTLPQKGILFFSIQYAMNLDLSQGTFHFH